MNTMRISNNVLKLAFMIIISLVTVVVVLWDNDGEAQNAITHAFALTIGALLHSMGGQNDNG